MQRSHFETFAHLGDRIGCNQGAAGEELTSVRHAVADGIQLVERIDDAVIGIGQCIEDQVDAHRVVGDGLMYLERLLADRLVGQNPFAETDTLDKAFGEQLVPFIVHVDHLVLDRRTSAIQNENIHFLNFIFYFFVLFSSQFRALPHG